MPGCKACMRSKLCSNISNTSNSGSCKVCQCSPLIWQQVREARALRIAAVLDKLRREVARLADGHRRRRGRVLGHRCGALRFARAPASAARRPQSRAGPLLARRCARAPLSRSRGRPAPPQVASDDCHCHACLFCDDQGVRSGLCKRGAEKTASDWASEASGALRDPVTGSCDVYAHICVQYPKWPRSRQSAERRKPGRLRQRPAWVMVATSVAH